MAVLKSTQRKKSGYHVRNLLLLLFAVLLLWQSLWMPYFDGWRCSRIASELSQKYDLIIRYNDPSDFFVPPLHAASNNPEKGFFIGHANEQHALTALKGIHAALVKYPKELLNKYLKAVFISGVIKFYGVEVGGTYLHSWIYLSALEEFKPLGADLYEQNFHHELSSLFIKGANFPTIRWQMANESGFKYLPQKIDVIKSASEEKRRDPKEAPSWHKAGFVSDYGMSSMENDYNVYAALAMINPKKLKKLADQYPRIKAKTWILADFYSSLAPELREHMASAGLTKTPGSTQAHQEQQQ
jgi:hypothetical protein